MTTPEDLIHDLDLAPHPEGGWFRETWRDDAGPNRRGAGTAILYLLRSGEQSDWHRVDAAELSHFHAGAPLALRRAADADTTASTTLLGIDLGAGHQHRYRRRPA